MFGNTFIYLQVPYSKFMKVIEGATDLQVIDKQDELKSFAEYYNTSAPDYKLLIVKPGKIDHF